MRPVVVMHRGTHTSSDKLIEGAFESATALARQGFYAPFSMELPGAEPSEESVTVSPQTVPHNAGDGSLTTAPFRRVEHVEGTAESASAKPLQEPDVSSSEELLNTRSSLEELVIATPETVWRSTTDGSPPSEVALELNVSSSNELLDTIPLEELVTASPDTVPHNTIDGSSSTVPFLRENLVGGAAESASAPPAPDVSSSEEFLDDTSSEESVTTSPRTVQHRNIDGSWPSSSSLGSNILIRRPQNWYQNYHIRMNCFGSFSMYPDLGGPFQSIDEAEGSINRHLDGLRRLPMGKEQDKCSLVDWLVYQHKYYLDGTPKRGPNSPNTNTNDVKSYFVQALLDKYNEENNLFGNLARELECLLRYQSISEKNRWYNHFNFTTKTKEAGDNPISCNLFFAEVSHMQGKDVWEVSYCCKIRPDENGHCYGCKNNGSPDMKHPDNTDAYIGGHLDGYLPFGDSESSESDDEQNEEAKLRYKYEDLDDPLVLESLYNLATQTT
ncbi:hypothetical protein ACP4OV_017272 [Aristida adscensionis]